jgi:uncharacterized OsmC-like protein
MSEEMHGFDIELERKTGYQFEVRFDKAHYAPIVVDEPPPIGDDTAPNAARYLAAAIGNCLSASLLFCASRSRVELTDVTATVHTEIARNDKGRLRITKVEVKIHPRGDLEGRAFERCRQLFEDYCVVTQSVRQGIDVEVSVEPA